MDALKLAKEDINRKTICLGLLAIVIFCLVNLLFSLFAYQAPQYEVAFGFLSYLVLIPLIILFFVKRLKRDGKYLKNNFKDYISFIIKNQIVMFIFYLLISNLVTIIIKNPNFSVNQQEIEKLPTLLLIFISIVYAPIVEELLFRGSLKRIIKNDKLFIIISGCIFGFLHTINEPSIMQLILIGLPYVFCGMYFAYMYVKTENICVPILCHFIHNTFAVLMLILSRSL